VGIVMFLLCCFCSLELIAACTFFCFLLSGFKIHGEARMSEINFRLQKINGIYEQTRQRIADRQRACLEPLKSRRSVPQERV
jgi:hypothetical protein